MADEPPNCKVELIRRLRCAEGHLAGIAAMIEREVDCGNVLYQILAVQGALREVNHLLLKHHLEVCLRNRLQGSDISARERCLDEVVSLYCVLGVATSFNRKERV